MPLWNLSQPCRSHRVLQQGARHCSLGQHVVLLVVSLVGPWPLHTLEPCCPPASPSCCFCPSRVFPGMARFGCMFDYLCILVFTTLLLIQRLYKLSWFRQHGLWLVCSWHTAGSSCPLLQSSRCKHPASMVWCLHLAWGWLWACASVLSPGWS